MSYACLAVLAKAIDTFAGKFVELIAVANEMHSSHLLAFDETNFLANVFVKIV